jgi:hypothetical protein
MTTNILKTESKPAKSTVVIKQILPGTIFKLCRIEDDLQFYPYGEILVMKEEMKGDNLKGLYRATEFSNPLVCHYILYSRCATTEFNEVY